MSKDEFYRKSAEIRACIGLKCSEFLPPQSFRDEGFGSSPCSPRDIWLFHDEASLLSLNCAFQRVLYVLGSSEDPSTFFSQKQNDLLETELGLNKTILNSVLRVAAGGEGEFSVKRLSEDAAYVTASSEQLAVARQPETSRVNPRVNGVVIISRVGNIIVKTLVTCAEDAAMAAQLAIKAAKCGLARLLSYRQGPGGPWHPALAKRLDAVLAMSRELQDGVTSPNYGQVTPEIMQHMLAYMFSNYKCASCGAVPQDRKTHKRCAGCEKVFYCSADCQRSHWPEHRAECRRAQQEAPQEAASSKRPAGKAK